VSHRVVDDDIIYVGQTRLQLISMMPFESGMAIPLCAA
jgi:archaeosine-15-forming tRNA-guanine transglycosylase